jgi:hypothetical protein
MDKHEILSEFCIPANEIDADLAVGDFGKLALTVEVIGKVNDMFIFRKHKRAVPEGNFKPEGAKELRERIIEKQEKDDKEDGE